LLFIATPAIAASSYSTDFESYNLGTIDSQDGWSSIGSVTGSCALYDHAVSDSLGKLGFGSQSLRISNAVVSGCFGDQTFSKSLSQEAGESLAENGGQSGGLRQKYFEAQFDLATTSSSQQTGLYMSVSPDRGDGARMSYLRFEDKADGIHVFFDDYQDGIVEAAGTCDSGDNFVESDIATLSRTSTHNIKFSMNFVNGSNNDVVKIYIDGSLVKTGTSWEGYFNYCEGNNTRTVDSLLFRTGGTQGDEASNTLGNGFLIDNLGLKSYNLPLTKDDCKKDSWKSYGYFKNQGDCVSFVATKAKNQPANLPTF
jgi:hypothetical protein